MRATRARAVAKALEERGGGRFGVAPAEVAEHGDGLGGRGGG